MIIDEAGSYNHLTRCKSGPLTDNFYQVVTFQSKYIFTYHKTKYTLRLLEKLRLHLIAKNTCNGARKLLSRLLNSNKLNNYDTLKIIFSHVLFAILFSIFLDVLLSLVKQIVKYFAKTE